MFDLRRRKIGSSTTVAPADVEDSKRDRGHSPMNTRRLWKVIGILAIVVLLVVAYVLVRVVPWKHGVPDIERPLVPYPYWRALIFNPMRYALAKYWDHRPQTHRRFSLSPLSSHLPRHGHVINLESDSERLERFWAHHPPAIRESIQRFPAHQWQSPIAFNQTDLIKERLLLQTKWQNRYPFLKDAIAQGRVGDAACALSHVLLWESYLTTNDPAKGTTSDHLPLDYIFVFEDDVQFVGSFQETLEVLAPDTADIVFLAPPAFKLVEIPFPHPVDIASQNNGTQKYSRSSATRVLGGAGAFAYIITREGARKLLEQTLPKSHKPIDLAILESPDIQVFLPLSGWPAVTHVGHLPSTRLNKNSPGRQGPLLRKKKHDPR